MQEMFFIFLLLLFVSRSSSTTPDYESCEIHSTTWNGGDLTEMVQNITSFHDCTEACRQSKTSGGEYCNYFTWNDEGHPYFPNTCMLFKNAGSRHESQNCISGILRCFCKAPYACAGTGTNIVEIFPRKSHYFCQRACNVHPECSNFTYFTSDHVYANLCILYSECSDIDTTCSGCCSGVKTFDACSNYFELNSPARNELASDTAAKFSDHLQYPPNLPDWRTNDTFKSWYRFTGEAGTRLAEKFPGFQHCGSKEPMWLEVDEDHQLPSIGMEKIMYACEPSKYRKDSCKYRSTSINVMNCGKYFLYELSEKYGHTWCGSKEN